MRFCEDYPCCGHEMGDCDGSLYGSGASIQSDPHLSCDHAAGVCDMWGTDEDDLRDAEDEYYEKGWY